MATKRHKPEEIVTKLRQVEVLVGRGMGRMDAIREVRITEQIFYRWRKQYGGMGSDKLKEPSSFRRIEPLRRHWFEPNGEGTAVAAGGAALS
jgi:transposase